MLNQVVLVGRLTSNLEAKELEDGKKVTNMTLAIPRSFKNADGEYETDFVECTLWNNIAENTAEYCKTGDIIGVKGRLQTRMIDNADGTKHKKVEMIAEKVTFLSSGSKRQEEKMENNDNSDIANNNVQLDENVKEHKKNKK